VNNKIKAEAPNAEVIVLDYPRIFNGEDCNTATFFDVEEMKRMNKASEELRDVIKAATVKAGAHFIPVDVIPTFDHHAVCDPFGSGEADEWINGASFPVNESYHPKVVGQQHYYTLIHGITG
jgi:hypothetical protein